MPLTAAELQHLIAQDLARREQAHQLRQRRTVNCISPTRLLIDDAPFINFASNDYLGLAHHPSVVDAVCAAAQAYGAGSGASALITGHTPAHRDCEQALAQWKATQDAVLLPSGYQANLAAIQTLAALGAHRQGVRFLIDKLAHASLIDAARASGAAFRVFPHNHINKLLRLLEAAPAGELQVVLTESIFSMDGDAADLAGIVALKQKFGFVLLLDEAHGSGVYGPAGAGYAAETGVAGYVDVSVVTLSKAVGVSGGAVCASTEFCNALVNFGRAYVYSTSVPPMIAAGVQAALGVMKDEPRRQARVRRLAREFRREVSGLGYALPPGDSPIVPIIVGDEESALCAAKELLEAGYLAPAVRPPTVPRGSSRLRITLNSEHTDQELRELVAVLRRLKPGKAMGAQK